MQKSETAPIRETKAAILRKLLSRKAGASVSALQTATGWQPHSVRAALSGLRKAGYIIERAEAAKPGGIAVYHLTGGPDANQ